VHFSLDYSLSHKVTCAIFHCTVRLALANKADFGTPWILDFPIMDAQPIGLYLFASGIESALTLKNSFMVLVCVFSMLHSSFSSFLSACLLSFFLF
jgi:hypothetical protein